MQRRTLLALTATGVASLAGCTSSAEVHTDETITDDAMYSLDLSAGDQVQIDVTVRRGMFAIVQMWRDGDDSDLLDEDVDTEDSFQVKAEQDGVHRIAVTLGGDRIDVTIAIDRAD